MHSWRSASLVSTKHLYSLREVYLLIGVVLQEIEAQLAALDMAGIETRALSVSPAMVSASGQSLPNSLIERVNDRFAELIACCSRRLPGLATIDAFQGESSAREVAGVKAWRHLY